MSALDKTPQPGWKTMEEWAIPDPEETVRRASETVLAAISTLKDDEEIVIVRETFHGTHGWNMTRRKRTNAS
jgi:hypothetical protein